MLYFVVLLRANYDFLVKGSKRAASKAIAALYHIYYLSFRFTIYLSVLTIYLSVLTINSCSLIPFECHLLLFTFFRIHFLYNYYIISSTTRRLNIFYFHITQSNQSFLVEAQTTYYRAHLALSGYDVFLALLVCHFLTLICYLHLIQFVIGER